jgi:hypothetical protein
MEHCKMHGQQEALVGCKIDRRAHAPAASCDWGHEAAGRKAVLTRHVRYESISPTAVQHRHQPAHAKVQDIPGHDRQQEQESSAQHDWLAWQVLNQRLRTAAGA